MVAAVVAAGDCFGRAFQLTAGDDLDDGDGGDLVLLDCCRLVVDCRINCSSHSSSCLD